MFYAIISGGLISGCKILEHAGGNDASIDNNNGDGESGVDNKNGDDESGVDGDSNESLIVDNCNEVEECESPDSCYTNSELKIVGKACYEGQLLYWSNHESPFGKGENFEYGHWYKASNPNLHLVDQFSSQFVKSNKIFADVTSMPRANNGLYYLAVTPVNCNGSRYCNLYYEFGIYSSSGAENSTLCNWVNINQTVNNNACSIRGMRLPRLRETTIQITTLEQHDNYDSCAYTDGPEISAANGVPAVEGASMIASRPKVGLNYMIWSGSSIIPNISYSTDSNVVCVTP